MLLHSGVFKLTIIVDWSCWTVYTCMYGRSRPRWTWVHFRWPNPTKPIN